MSECFFSADLDFSHYHIAPAADLTSEQPPFRPDLTSDLPRPQHARQRADTGHKTQQTSPRKQRRPTAETEGGAGGGWRSGHSQSEPVPAAASGDPDAEEVIVGSASSASGRVRLESSPGPGVWTGYMDGIAS